MGKNLLTAKVTIRGTRPLLWCHFGPEALPLEKQEKAGVAGNDPTEWRRTMLATREGQLYLEPAYIFGCCRDGAKFTRKGRGSLQPLVTATLQVVEPRVLIDRFLPAEGDPPTDPEAPVYIDIRGVRNPSTKARNVRYRLAASPGWSAQFTLLFDRTVVSRGELEAVIRDAGKLCGLGDGRAIGFGRFEVESFEVLDHAEEAAS